MERKVYSVLQINRYIKGLIEDDYILGSMWIRGEISNYKRHSSGHIYFTLKDETSSIDCVMFKEYASMMPFELYNGLKAVICGYISVYEKSGTYKLYVQIVDPEGSGELSIAFEALKNKLSEEGLFDPDYKREIEKRPQTIAVITSPTGAAVRDIIQIAGRRNPSVNVVVFPALVQGEYAADSIVDAIESVNEWGKADTIIVGRGGGSMEDLWCFNEEKVARAIFASEIPVISAVGHETDFTIADFVADMRAPTPSAAAELAVNSVEEDMEIVSSAETRLTRAYKGYMLKKRLELEVIKAKTEGLRPDKVFELKERELKEKAKTLDNLMIRFIDKKRTGFEAGLKNLEALSPLSVLKRGYSVAYHNGRILKDPACVKSGDEISLHLEKGNVYATVKGTEING
ncbi:MAG: exodeoxyribonuclease VII large subunit [Lachnospiraceae bacterium]|nr:exodeoxyribonuclease VII large subunit [Lachnospiraceae bacterium]